MISLTILCLQDQCCLFARFITIFARNKGCSAANDCQFLHPHRLEGSPLLLTQMVSMFKNFCRCNAAVSDLYDVKSKNKIVVIFFS